MGGEGVRGLLRVFANFAPDECPFCEVLQVNGEL